MAKLTPFAERVYRCTARIPRGRVATYGQIAALIGQPGAARAVGNCLHVNPDPAHVPCHRVVNSAGHLAEHFGLGGSAVQQAKLEQEGVAVRNFRVDLGIFQWKPEDESC